MRAMIIVNPAAGGVGADLVAELAARCRRLCGEVGVHWTTAPGEAVGLAASSTSDYVLSVGGDGTAREVVHGLAENPRRPTLFIVPAGTSNSCYRSFWGTLGWPDALESALAHPRSRTRRLDLARLAETGALVLAGAASGFPPQAIRKAEALRHIPGPARYEQALTALAATYRPYPGRVLVDGVEVHSGPTLLANVGGSRYRGGQFEVLPHSIIDDGLLDVCVISGRQDPLTMMALARSGTHVTHPGITYARGRTITIERTDGHPLPFEHDGEVLPDPGPTFTLTVLPHAIPILVGDAADQGRRPHAA